MLNASLRDSKILIIDDHAPHNLLVQETLRHAGYARYKAVTESTEVISVFDEFRPDLILLDLHMPGLDGLEVLQQLLLRLPEQSYLPIMVVSGDASGTARQTALSLGAKDFINKPIDTTEVVLRINTLLETRFLQAQLEEQNRKLDQRVREGTRDLENAQLEILHRLALVAECRDDDTGRHTYRVGELAALLGRSLKIPERDVELIRCAAPLHDLGKIAIPDKILLKRGGLTAREYELIKTHTVIGACMLSGSRFPILQLAEKIALNHHEHWDGNGYRGLQSETIPLEARIVSIADAFDVMTHSRSYKDALPVRHAVAEINSQSGRQFDPYLVDVFTELFRLDHLQALSEALRERAAFIPGQIEHWRYQTMMSDSSKQNGAGERLISERRNQGQS